MSVEVQVISALRRYQAESASAWSDQARTVAYGIERTGLPGLLSDMKVTLNDQAAGMAAMGSSLSRTNGALMAVSATMAAGFNEVCRSLSETNAHLANVEHLLANPLSTAAAERFRRGVHALSQEWYEPALRELDAAIEQDPFQAPSHFARGLALGAVGMQEESLAAFKDAIMFTGTNRALFPLLAGASILAAQVAQSLGRRGEAAEILSAGLGKVPDCAELLLAQAHATGSRPSLERGIRLAPELGIVAIAAGVPNAEDVADLVAADPMGPVKQMHAAAATMKQAGLSFPVPTSAPEAMTFHRSWRDQCLPRAEVYTREAVRSLEVAQSRFGYADRQAQQFTPSIAARIPRARARAIAWTILGVLYLAAFGFCVWYGFNQVTIHPRQPGWKFFMGAVLVIGGGFALGLISKWRGALKASASDASHVRSTSEQNGRRRAELATARARAAEDLAEAENVATLARKGLEEAERSVPPRTLPILDPTAGTTVILRALSAVDTIPVLAVIRRLTGADLDGAQAMIGALPCEVMRCNTHEEAVVAAADLATAGAVVDVQ